MSISKGVYLDNNATTPVDPRVLEAMLPYFKDKFGNAASIHHKFGWDSADAVERSRAELAEMINAETREIVFTSGATESDNISIKGIAELHAGKGKHIITSPTEHKAVLDTCKWLENRGCEITYIPVDEYGVVDLDALEGAIRDDTILVSIMLANNETGTIAPADKIGAICRSKDVLFHCDATQGLGKIPVDVEKMQVDLMSISAHKIYGPKGIGALYIRRRGKRVRCAPLIHGGGHERGMRSGTLNVPGIVGFAKAASIARDEMQAESARLIKLRDKLQNELMGKLESVTLNGHPESRLPNTVNLSFAWVEGEALMLGMPEIAVSSGSACTSSSLEPSHVLRAMGIIDILAHNSLRFSLGRFSTEEEIDYTIEQVVLQVERLRELSPLYEMAKAGKDINDMLKA